MTVTEGIKAGCNFCTLLFDSLVTEYSVLFERAHMSAAFYIKPIRNPQAAGHQGSGLRLEALDITLVQKTAGVLDFSRPLHLSKPLARFHLAADPDMCVVAVKPNVV